MGQRALLELHDKLGFARIAAGWGLAVPETWRGDAPEAAALAASRDFVVKPLFSCSGIGVRVLERGSAIPADRPSQVQPRPGLGERPSLQHLLAHPCRPGAGHRSLSRHGDGRHGGRRVRADRRARDPGLGRAVRQPGRLERIDLLRLRPGRGRPALCHRVQSPHDQRRALRPPRRSGGSDRRPPRHAAGAPARGTATATVLPMPHRGPGLAVPGRAVPAKCRLSAAQPRRDLELRAIPCRCSPCR